MQQSPNMENRRPPSPRVFYPPAEKHEKNPESPRNVRASVQTLSHFLLVTLRKGFLSDVPYQFSNDYTP